MNNVDKLEEFQKAIQQIADNIKAGVVKATEAAGKELFLEIQSRAKGTIRDSLTLSVFETERGAEAVIQVENSEPSGKEHHAVFLEYGTSKMAAEPFMRPGFDASAQKAVDRFSAVLAEGIKG